jgi:hypothetical protein
VVALQAWVHVPVPLQLRQVEAASGEQSRLQDPFHTLEHCLTQLLSKARRTTRGEEGLSRALA